MRIFKEFPNSEICPICKTNTNTECVLIGITDTQEGNNMQAQCFHLNCIELLYYPEQKIIAGRFR